MSDQRSEAAQFGSWAIVGDGRVGRALVASLPWLNGPFGRGFNGHDFDVVLLTVPDGEISWAAGAIESGPIVGHCAGSLGLDVLAPHEAFGLHPLIAITLEGAQFAGAGAAIAGSTPRALVAARTLAGALHMLTVEIADKDRAAYHAAASIASNFLVTLEDAAEVLLGTVGADRNLLIPLVRATVENWVSLGVPAALTGPIVRGDEATVARQRAAVTERAPQLLAMFDALADRTRGIVAGRHHWTILISSIPAVDLVARLLRGRGNVERSGDVVVDQWVSPPSHRPHPNSIDTLEHLTLLWLEIRPNVEWCVAHNAPLTTAAMVGVES